MSQIPEIKDIDTSVLAAPVQQLLGSTTAEVLEWEHHPISYIVTETSNLGLHRFRGRARDEGTTRPWSIILKAVIAPLNSFEQSSWNYHRREILAYQEGLLADLPRGLSAPRCLGVTEYPDGLCWLWLEDVAEISGIPWSLSEYGLAANHLGQFNGAYLTGYPRPKFPWLSQNWVQGWLGYYDDSIQNLLQLVRDEHFWEMPLLRSAFSRPMTEEILRLWDHHDSFLSALERLPQTFCHLDAYRPNLFIRQHEREVEELLAIDWVFAGKGAVGEEIANLLAASLIWFEYDAINAKSLDDTIFTAYLNGLRQAGWDGDSRQARLGYTAACALRWGLVGMWWMLSLGDSDKKADLEKHWGHPLEKLVAQWSKTTTYVLGMAREAYELQHDLF